MNDRCQEEIPESAVRDFYIDLYRIIDSSAALAYRHGTLTRTFREMREQMMRINSLLAGHSQARVVVYAGKTFPTYSAIYAVVLSGNVWIPVNPDLPEDRNLEMIRASKPDLILTDRPLPAKIARFAEESGAEIADLSALVSPQTPSRAFALGKGLGTDDIAYIMFTSGSSGTPKGVPMTHGNYIPFIRNAMRLLPFKKGEVFADYHDFSFDISIFYVFCAPLTESALAPILKDEERAMPLRHILHNKVTVLATIPSTMLRIRMLARNKPTATGIRILFVCGEPFRLDLLDFCLNKLGVPDVYNFYGLTETGVENFHHRCSPADLAVYAEKNFAPIGLPLPGNPVRVTPEGELMIAGPQVTAGYLEGRSPERFEVIDGVRWFHTGDRVTEHGGVYFCNGRFDSQIKLHGYRIELMDIEANLRKIVGIDEAVCFVAPWQGQDYLVAAVKSEPALDPEDVRLRLRAALPDYMIPTEFFSIAEIPLNKAGKIDRPAIRRMFTDKLSGDVSNQPPIGARI